MGGLERRIKNLEAALAGDECPVCGEDPGAPVTDYEIVWEDIYTEDLDLEEEPECCDSCGRQLEYIVVWDDLILRPEPEE
jgi:hypothetical protein